MIYYLILYQIKLLSQLPNNHSKYGCLCNCVCVCAQALESMLYFMYMPGKSFRTT